jgi:hypothetical protein
MQFEPVLLHKTLTPSTLFALSVGFALCAAWVQRLYSRAVRRI